MPTKGRPVKILNLKISNVRGIEVVDITPTNNLVEISGKNGAGKTSILDAVFLALGGRDATKTIKTPLRNGTDEGHIIVTTDLLTIERHFNAKGTTRLKVTRSENGISSNVTSPQSTLDALRLMTIDPTHFADLPPLQQRDALLGLLDLGTFDLDTHEQERAAVYAERTDLGRRAKAIGDITVDPDLSDVERSAQDYIERIRKAEAHNREIESSRQEAIQLDEDIRDAEAQIAELQEQIAHKRDVLRFAAETAAKELIDTKALEQDLADVEEHNVRVRANNAARAQAQEKAALLDQYKQLSETLTDLDTLKADTLAQANVPLEGLSITTDGITLDGVPFTEVNPGHQIRAALHILAAQDPAMRVIQIRNGALLDADGRHEIETFAYAHDFQVWLETINPGSDDAIVIEAGKVAS